MSVANLWDVYHRFRLLSYSKKYCWIMPYYSSPTCFYLRLAMSLSLKPAIWQQFLEKVFGNIQKGERCKTIRDNSMVFQRRDKHFVDLANPFWVLMKFGLKISPHKCLVLHRSFVIHGSYINIENGKSWFIQKEKTVMQSSISHHKIQSMIVDHFAELSFFVIIS